MYVNVLSCVDREGVQGRRAEERDRPLTRDVALGLTFCATWLTHGEVQLLRSGPRGFQMTWSAKHWKEAMPGEKAGRRKMGRGEWRDNKH